MILVIKRFDTYEKIEAFVKARVVGWQKNGLGGLEVVL
jgi:hypothetical protein